MVVFEKLFPILSSAACALALSMPALSALPALPARPAPPPDLATPPPAGLGLLEAVELMLANDPNVAIVETQVRSAKGALLVASGQFDPLLTESLTQASTRTPLSPLSSLDAKTTENDLGFVQQFRTGLSISPQLQLLRTEDPNQPPGGANAAAVSFTFRQPLLRGRGRSATAAQELSAEREVTASGLDLAHATAQRIVAVIDQYWSTRASAENLAILG